MLVSLANRLSFVSALVLRKHNAHFGHTAGGGSGIGRAVALQLARAGSDVIVVDRNAEAARACATFINTNINAAGQGGSALSFGADVTKMSDLQAALQAGQAHFAASKLTVGVNCAGITKDKFMVKMSEDDWDAVLDVNLKGTFLVTKAVAQAIAENQSKTPELIKLGGSIVNIASIIGKTGNIGQANYSASKGGVVAFCKTAAKELARNRIRVNSVLPGFIATPMAAAVPEKVQEKMRAQIPLGAFGEPEDIAETCVFLASDRAKYITGAGNLLETFKARTRCWGRAPLTRNAQNSHRGHGRHVVLASL